MTAAVKIAILGPLGSYSEIAARRYIADRGWRAEIVPCPNIVKAFEAVGRGCQHAVIPIENMVEGYVPLSLDLLADTRYPITGEVVVPINFSFVANCERLQDLERVYVQFVTEGQCRDFLATLPESAKLITTDSNSASWEEVRAGRPGEGAIVPQHLLPTAAFRLSVPQVNDRQGNRTRFIVLSEQPGPAPAAGPARTTIVIRELADAPGALYQIIGAFARRGINLSCLMSRPNKVELGRYFFFIDIDAAYPADAGLVEALAEIGQGNEVKVLGSYPIPVLS